MKHLSLPELFKRIAYDASEFAIGEQFEAEKRGEGLTEEFSEQLSNDLIYYYQDELNRKQKLYDRPLLDPIRLYVNGAELRENIEQCKAIIEILKSNKHERTDTNPLEKTEAP